MAAGQQKKRLHAASLTKFNLREQPLSKKKKLESPDMIWNLRPHISLKWDDNLQKAVARSEQIGILRRELSHFVNHLPTSACGLADVLSVPEEVFELEDVTKVLSYEVWKTYLSESERNFLSQFLPMGKDADEVVKPLLTGENLHFGNPFKHWSACLVSGKLHPDVLLRRNQHVKTSKKHFFDEIKTYHDGIIKRLLNWKERWESCKDPEKEIVEALWRKGVGSSYHGCSSMLLKPSKANLLKERACDACTDPGNDSKYISYFKISRRQHLLVKNLKTGGDGILPKSLGRVLGDIKGLNLQPYEEFEEEEKRRLHEHWLKLAHNDLPLAFGVFQKLRMSNEHCRMVIRQELLEKVTKTTECLAYNEAEDTESRENDDCLNAELVYGTENEDSEANSEQLTAKKTEKSDEKGTHKDLPPGFACNAEGYEIEGNYDSSTHQSESEVSKASHESSDFAEVGRSLSQDGEAYSKQTSGGLHPQNIDKSPPHHGTNSDFHHLGGVCSPSHLEDHLKRIPSLNSHHPELDSEVFDCIVIEDNSKLAADTSPVHEKSLEHCSSAENSAKCKTTLPMDARDLERLPSLNRNPDPNSVAVYQETNENILNLSDKTVLSSFHGNMDVSTIMKTQDCIFPAKNSWDDVEIQNSYSEAKGCNAFPFIDNLALGGSNSEKEHPPLDVNLEGKLLIEEAARLGNDMPLYNSYANQYHNVTSFSKEQIILAPSFSKEQGSPLSYEFQHFNNLKRSNFPVFGQSNGLSQPPLFDMSFQEQKDPFEQRQTGNRDLYIQQMANKVDYSNGRFVSHGSTSESQDWLAFTAGNGGLSGHNLFPSDLRPPTGWPMMEPSVGASSRSTEGRNADGSLFSILPRYNKVSLSPLGNPSNPDRLAFPSNFVPEAVSDVQAFSNNGYGHSSNLLSNSRSQGAAWSSVPPKMGSLPQVNFPSQNPNFSGFMNNSNTRPWNR